MMMMMRTYHNIFASHPLCDDFSLGCFQIPQHPHLPFHQYRPATLLLEISEMVLLYVSLVLSLVTNPFSPVKGRVLEHLVPPLLLVFLRVHLQLQLKLFDHLKMLFHIHLYVFEFCFYFEYCSWQDTDSTHHLCKLCP